MLKSLTTINYQTKTSSVLQLIQRTVTVPILQESLLPVNNKKFTGVKHNER